MDLILRITRKWLHVDARTTKRTIRKLFPYEHPGCFVFHSNTKHVTYMMRFLSGLNPGPHSWKWQKRMSKVQTIDIYPERAPRPNHHLVYHSNTPFSYVTIVCFLTYKSHPIRLSVLLVTALIIQGYSTQAGSVILTKPAVDFPPTLLLHKCICVFPSFFIWNGCFQLWHLLG